MKLFILIFVLMGVGSSAFAQNFYSINVVDPRLTCPCHNEASTAEGATAYNAPGVGTDKQVPKVVLPKADKTQTLPPVDGFSS